MTQPNSSTPTVEITQENIFTVVKDLQEGFANLTRRNQQLLGAMKSLRKENNDLKEKVYDLEVDISKLDSYGRRCNIEISGISEGIKQPQLEKHVLKIFAKLEIHLQSYDLAACHRMGKKMEGKNRTVIVRFINRKDAYTCLKYGKHLKDFAEYRNIYFGENLCPTNRRIFNYLYKLKKENKVSKVWTYNGEVCYKVPEDETTYRAQHISEVEDYFHNLNNNSDNISSDSD